jgi:hypothetical protein
MINMATIIDAIRLLAPVGVGRCLLLDDAVMVAKITLTTQQSMETRHGVEWRY